MDTTQMLSIFHGLPNSEQEAVNQTIMDIGISDIHGMIDAYEQIQTYLLEQPVENLTFEQFRSAKVALTRDHFWCEEQGLEVSSLEILQYPEGSFIIVEGPGAFHLIIECSEWRSNDLKSLEEILYQRWYLS